MSANSVSKRKYEYSSKNDLFSTGAKRSKHKDTFYYAQKKEASISYYDRRICLKSVPSPFTKPQVLKLVEDFEGVTIYMP